MEVIRQGSEVLVMVYRDNEWPKGLNFFTEGGMFIQAGSWVYDKGKRLQDHLHKTYERTATLTQELVYVKKGAMKVLIYDQNKTFHSDLTLAAGDLAIMVGGGHGYEILEDNTQILEVKNGPFVSVENDKEKF